MAIIDPEQEKKRLQESYSRMADGELESLAEDSASLTEVARHVLNEEMIRRGLGHVEPTPPEAEQAVEAGGLVTIRKFRDLHEAWMAKGSLDSAGIECFLVDDNMVRMDWFISNFLGGVKLRVRSEDRAAADEILDQSLSLSEDFDVGNLES